MTGSEIKELKRRLDDPNWKPGWITRTKVVSLVDALERERRKTKKLQDRIDKNYKEKLREDKN